MAEKAYVGIENVASDSAVTGYTRLEYIQSSKTQWIDPNYFVKYGDVVTVDMAFLDTQSYFGFHSSNTNRFGIGVAKGAYEIVNGSNSSMAKPASDTERHTFVIDTTGRIQFDDTFYTVAAMATDFAAAYSFTLFGRRQAATGTSYRGNHRIWGFKVENGGSLIMNLVPYKRDSDGVVGLLDTVSKTFHTNAGTGTFTYAEMPASIAQELAKGYIGINGKARKLLKAYIGDENGIAQLCFNPSIYTWTHGTDEMIVSMVAAADRGEINLADYWTVGDTRKVTLSAMPATGVGESHETQEVELVLMHAGGYELNEAVASGRTECSFVVGMKNCLNEVGYMNPTNTNVGSWEGSARRTWCNEVFKNAMPQTLLPVFKQFKTVTATEYNATALTTSIDYFALPALKEVKNQQSYSNETEANALSVFKWYNTSANRAKTASGVRVRWWFRSPNKSMSTNFCAMHDTSDILTSAGAASTFGLSPFGCI